MPPLPYPEIVKMLEQTSQALHDRGDYIVRSVLPIPKVLTYTEPNGFTLVKVTEGATDAETYITVAGGGAYEAGAEPKLFHHLATREFIFGGPFAKHYPDGTVTFGHRIVLPATVVLSGEIRYSIRYINDMIYSIGQIAQISAKEIIPEVGGILLDGSGDREHDKILLVSQML